jgi:hypothetical protein
MQKEPYGACQRKFLFVCHAQRRREMGGRELVRPLTLYREDGSLAGGWDR